MSIHLGQVVVDQVQGNIDVMNHQIMNDADLCRPDGKGMNSIAFDKKRLIDDIDGCTDHRVEAFDVPHLQY
jgi:hypothetical protein